jgi:hypothetical protein
LTIFLARFPQDCKSCKNRGITACNTDNCISCGFLATVPQDSCGTDMDEKKTNLKSFVPHPFDF